MSSGASSWRASGRPSSGGRLKFRGRLARLADADRFDRLLVDAVKTEWVVYAKPPFDGPGQVLKYLARYTHRVAISNRRLVGMKDGRVRFRYKDYAQGCKRRTMELAATEFLRRFLLHVLPTGFVRIRHYGLLSNRHRREKLADCRKLLGAAASPEVISPEALALATPLSLEVGVTEMRCATLCPKCGVGRMVIIEDLTAVPQNARRLASQFAQHACPPTQNFCSITGRIDRSKSRLLPTAAMPQRRGANVERVEPVVERTRRAGRSAA